MTGLDFCATIMSNQYNSLEWMQWVLEEQLGDTVTAQTNDSGIPLTVSLSQKILLLYDFMVHV